MKIKFLAIAFLAIMVACGVEAPKEEVPTPVDSTCCVVDSVCIDSALVTLEDSVTVK